MTIKICASVVIDNVVVSTTHSGGRVSTPIHLFKKLHSAVNVEALPVVTLGSRRLDNLLIQQFMEGEEVQFDDLLALCI